MVEAGLGSSRWQHLDDTGTPVNGSNWHFCNPLYTGLYHHPYEEACQQYLAASRGLEGLRVAAMRTPARFTLLKQPDKEELTRRRQLRTNSLSSGNTCPGQSVLSACFAR